MVFVTFLGSTVHITLVADHWFIRFETIVLFYKQYMTYCTDDILDYCSVLNIFTEIVGAKKSSNARDRVKMVIIYQIHVDTGSFVGAGTPDALVAVSGTDHHHAYFEHFFKRLYIVQTRRSIQGNCRHD